MFLECLITQALGRKTDKVVGSQLKIIYYQYQIRDFFLECLIHKSPGKLTAKGKVRTKKESLDLWIASSSLISKSYNNGFRCFFLLQLSKTPHTPYSCGVVSKAAP